MANPLILSSKFIILYWGRPTFEISCMLISIWNDLCTGLCLIVIWGVHDNDDSYCSHIGYDTVLSGRFYRSILDTHHDSTFRIEVYIIFYEGKHNVKWCLYIMLISAVCSRRASDC
jgi:hypothetical protein